MNNEDYEKMKDTLSLIKKIHRIIADSTYVKRCEFFTDSIQDMANDIPYNIENELTLKIVFGAPRPKPVQVSVKFNGFTDAESESVLSKIEEYAHSLKVHTEVGIIEEDESFRG